MLALPPIGAALIPPQCGRYASFLPRDRRASPRSTGVGPAALLDEGADQGTAADQRCKYIGKGAGRWTFAPRISACP